MELISLGFVLIVGLFAGFLNVIVGGGSSITTPFLVFLGVPTIVSIGTNRFGMMFNNGLGAIKYYQKNALDVRTAVILSVFASVGSIIGAIWVLGIAQDFLNKILAIILIIEIIVILLGGRKLGLEQTLIKLTKKHWTLGALSCFLIGLYGGFIGLAITSITMFILVTIFRTKFIESAAISKVITFTISFFASIIFLSALKVDFLVALILVPAYLVGAHLGVNSAIKAGNHKVKMLFVIVAIVSAIKLLFF